MLTGHTPAQLRDCTRVELSHTWALAAEAALERERARKRQAH